MDQFVQSMSIILHRMLIQAERIENAINKNDREQALADNEALKAQAGQLIEIFDREINRK